MRARDWTSILSMMAVGAHAVGCGSDARTDCASYSDCTADGSAGMDGETVADGAPDVAAPDADMGTLDASHPSDAAGGRDADAAVDAFVCDPTQSPSTEPCLIDEAYGIFVAPAGSDANPGTKALPVATIGRGMDLAKTASKRVYVCAGRFTEKVTIGTSRDGAAVYGGLDCATWRYDTNNKVVVAPPQTGYALELDGLQRGATLEDVEFDALDANPSHPGESSVAVFANGAQNVVLRRVAMVAGAVVATGTAGPSGRTAGDPSNAYAGSLDGTGAGDAGAPPAKLCACVDGTTSSTGGRGGSANQMPSAGLPSYGVAGAGGAGTNQTSCGSGSTTGDGADAPLGSSDVPSAALGALSASGWAPGTGGSGSNGKPGQGGGGGGDGKSGTGTGGSGACGGCGGVGGKPGGGGGSSIALLSLQSSIALQGCTLAAKGAGNGGSGGAGEIGQAGGAGGLQVSSGCPGGAGGAGAGGNGGQGGPGGLSLGLGYKGSAPTVDGTPTSSATTLAGVSVGLKGTGGPPGGAGAAAGNGFGQPGVAGAPGQDGTAQAVMQLP